MSEKGPVVTAVCSCSCHYGPAYTCDQAGGCGAQPGGCPNTAGKPTTPADRRQAALEQLATQIDELLVQVHTRATVVRPRVEKRGRRGRKRVTVERLTVHTHHTGLIDQLERAVVPSGSPGWDADGALSPRRGGKPRSRPPVTAALDELAEIASGAAQQRARLRAHLGMSRGRRLDTAGTLRDLVGLAHRLPASEVDLLEDVVRKVGRWRASARTMLAYDTAWVTLREFYCPECLGRLRVRSDASSAVMCFGLGRVEGPAGEGEPWPLYVEGCGVCYSRSEWLVLREQQQADAGDDEAAEDEPEAEAVGA